MTAPSSPAGRRRDALPLTYDESRARFRHAAAEAGLGIDAHAVTARGPFGQTLTIDVATLGAARPRRALVVLSGVHGVEGFVCSALQTDLVARGTSVALPPDTAVVVVHAVNPWGMAHGRRQNESNVDLNRNWGRGRGEPRHNDDYDLIHPLACPDVPDLPSAEDLLAAAAPVVAERGADSVRDAITTAPSPGRRARQPAEHHHDQVDRRGEVGQQRPAQEARRQGHRPVPATHPLPLRTTPSLIGSSRY